MPVEQLNRDHHRKVTVVNSKHKVKSKRIKRRKGGYFLRLNPTQQRVSSIGPYFCSAHHTKTLVTAHGCVAFGCHHPLRSRPPIFVQQTDQDYPAGYALENPSNPLGLLGACPVETQEVCKSPIDLVCQSIFEAEIPYVAFQPNDEKRRPVHARLLRGANLSDLQNESDSQTL